MTGSATAESAMGWLRVVGSLEIQISFAKEPYERDDILQKRRMILRSLLIVATQYSYIVSHSIDYSRLLIIYVGRFS